MSNFLAPMWCETISPLPLGLGVPTSFTFGRWPPLADQEISPIDRWLPGVVLVGTTHHASPLVFLSLPPPIKVFREDDQAWELLFPSRPPPGTRPGGPNILISLHNH